MPVRGNERLAWDQPAPSYPRLQQYGFRIYVEGSGAPLAGVECLDSASSGAFPCSARLPQMPDGTHTIQLAAIADGAESDRSGGLIVSVGQGRTVVDGQRETGASVGQPESAPAAICIEDACFDLRRRVTRALPVSAPALLPDGRLLFVEGDRHVRLVDAGMLRREPALSLAEGSRIVALLTDGEFATNRIVRIAATVRSPRGGRTFDVTRVRELDGRLGEAAVIVSEIALPPTGEPRVAQDGQGRFYVAVPGNEDPASRRAVAGAILRFSNDGLTWAADLGSPVFAAGVADPLAIAVDRRRARLWLSGRDRTGRAQVQWLPLQPDVIGPSFDAAGIAATRALVGIGDIYHAATARAGLIVADDEGRLAFVRPEAAGGMTAVEIPGEHVIDVTGTTRGAVLLTTRTTGAAAPAFSVFTLEPAARR